MKHSGAVAEARENLAAGLLADNTTVKGLLAEIERLNNGLAQSAAVIAAMDKEKRELSSHLAVPESKVATTLTLTNLLEQGLNSGHIRSKPMLDTSDPEATEWPTVYLIDQVKAVQAKLLGQFSHPSGQRCP